MIKMAYMMEGKESNVVWALGSKCHYHEHDEHDEHEEACCGDEDYITDGDEYGRCHDE